VRPVLVTALNLDLDSRIWWPSKLDRTRDPSEELATTSSHA
jgi:RND superfamily putative drug exporter